jgi:hypothetical protein
VNGVAVILSLVWFVRVTFTVTADVEDLGQYWQAAVNIVQVGDPYATTPEPGTVKTPSAVRTQPFPNPPLLAYLMLPIAGLEREVAMWLWYGLNILMLAALCWIAIDLSGSQIARNYWGVVWLIFLAIGPTRLCLQLGQLGIVLALLAIGGYALIRRSPWGAGLLLALGTLIKLYPGFLGVFFLRVGPRRVAWWAAGSGVVIVALSLVAHGLRPYTEYMRKVLFGGYYPYQAEFNVSLVGFWRRLLVASDYTDVLINSPLLANLLIAVCALALLVGCWLVGGSEHAELHLLQFSAYISAMLLLAPVNGYYNLPILILPVLLVIRALEQERNPRLMIWLAFAIALISIAPTWTDGTPLYNPLHIGWGTLLLTPSVYGQVLLFGITVWLTRRSLGGVR